MGSIFTHRDKGISNDEWFAKECFGEGRTILASATIKGTYFAAVREDATGEVWAAVILTYRSPRSHHNFGWKSMTETMGPGDYDCPAKVLDLLTETDDKYALEWRAACRARIAKKAALPKLVDGMKIRIPAGLTFIPHGVRHDCYEFTYVKHPRRRNVFRTEQGFLVRLPDWQNYSFEVVK